jgi:hypothetical protein
VGSGKKKVRKKRGASPEASSKEKGAIVEKVVVMTHEAPGVEVRRQFDVLLVGNVAGYQTCSRCLRNMAGASLTGNLRR